MQKVINGNSLDEILEVQDPDPFLEIFGFRYFEQYLKELDPWTQDYFTTNMDNFIKVFKMFSID